MCPTRTSKRQHQVPVFYLESFVDPEAGKPILWVYDKDGGEPRAQNPRDTAVEKDFYAFRLPDGSRSQELEQLLAIDESRAAPILKRWTNPRALPDPAEMVEVAQFLALTHTRVRRQVEVVKEILRELPGSMARYAVEDEDHLRSFYDYQHASGQEVSMPIEKFRQLLRDFDKLVKVEPNEKAALGLALSVTAVVRRQLLTMNWCLCTASEGGSFVTSDAPLTIFSRRGSRVAFGVGLALPETEVTFPISPRVCLLLDRSRTHTHRRVSQKVVSQINRRTAFGAERFVVAHVRSKAIQRLVQESARTRSMPKLDREAVRDRLDHFICTRGPGHHAGNQ